MDMKTGYKQTELGAIPKDWKLRHLGQCLKYPPDYGINAASVPFDSRYPAYLRITDITEDGQFSESTRCSVAHPASAQYLLSVGDIVFARTGASVGKSYLYDPKDGALVFADFLFEFIPTLKGCCRYISRSLYKHNLFGIGSRQILLAAVSLASMGENTHRFRSRFHLPRKSRS